ncbi:MAG TPA: M48 family metalloprotease [Phycisphaerales bacterium]|nr:M48 family metalloprotease [Phycisphaerales bacterium]
MLNLWVVAIFAVIFLRDSFPLDAPAPTHTGWIEPGGWGSWVVGVLPLAAIAGLVHLILWAVGRLLDERGSLRTLLIAERTLTASKFMTLLVHAGNVFVLGWLTGVRRLTGDLILVDELLCALPALLVVVCGWASWYGIERRLREAARMRQLDRGERVHPTPTLAQFVFANLRNQLTLTLCPLLFLAAWHELWERAFHWLLDRPHPPGIWSSLAARLDERMLSVVQLGLQLLGVAMIMALAPVLVRFLMDTVRMGPGPMRDRLLAMCRRHNVGCRDVLIWRTHNAMTNGAVVGLFGPLRYILLTDALLDAMPRRQVEAVMAHEIAHARYAHMPWLGGTIIVAIFGVGTVGNLLISGFFAFAGVPEPGLGGPGPGLAPVALTPDSSLLLSLAANGGLTVLTLGAGILVFGLVSRRFEWQADAFAAKALSLMPSSEPPLVIVGPGGIGCETAAPPLEVVPLSSDLIVPRSMGQGGEGPEGPTVTGPWLEHLTTPSLEDVPTEPIIRRSAVDAMAGALQSVADLNHIPRHRPSFRHGSIAQRQRYLRSLVGRRLDQLPIDRNVRWIKRVAGGLLVLMLVLLIVWALVDVRPAPV